MDRASFVPWGALVWLGAGCPGEEPPGLGCNTDSDCPSTQVCGAGGACASVDPCKDVRCDEGTVCEDGSCVPGGPCGAVNRLYPPAVLFVVDRSCSMAAELGASGVTKWEAAAAALSAAASALDEDLLLGLTLFPDTSGERCEQSDVAVPLGANSAASLTSLLDDALVPGAALFPDGPCVTNLDTAMEQAAILVGSSALDAQVVLVTDGRQAQCNEATGEADAANTMRALYDRGVETVVVGFDRQADAAVLDAFARAGGRPNPDLDVDFYPATEPTALEDTLLSLAEGALDCAFRLEEEPPDSSALHVFIDDVRTDAFSYDAATRVLTLGPAACELVQARTTAHVAVVFGGCAAP